MRSLKVRVVSVAGGLGLAAAVLASCSMSGSMAPTAARPAVAYGKPVAENDLIAWDIDIRASDGKGLPAGRGTAVEGKQIYDVKCTACHGADAKGGPQYGTMVGGIGSFKTNARILTPGSMYPYAPILFDYMRRSMPMFAPQTLSNDELYALSAYLLELNGLIPANAVMDAITLPKVMMPNRDGFLVDDRPDVKAVRCMQNCN